MFARVFQETLRNQRTPAASRPDDPDAASAAFENLGGRRTNFRVVVIRERVIEERHGSSLPSRLRAHRTLKRPFPLRRSSARIEPQHLIVQPARRTAARKRIRDRSEAAPPNGELV